MAETPPETGRRPLGQLPAPTPGSRVIVLAIAVAVALVAGFQLARWTAPAVPGAVGGTGPNAGHTHPAQAGPGAEVGGLSLSAAGYTLTPTGTTFTAGAAQPLTFQVRGPDGAAVTNYATINETKLHLLVVRRDLVGYQHLHPTLAADGTWSTPLTLPSAGMWRAVADFTVIGPTGLQTAMALGVDLTVAGGLKATALPAVARESSVDGYTVTYEGTPTPGATVPLVFHVYRNGTPVSTLEDYLGTLGHLVAFRQGDLGYLHVHADPPTDQPVVRFWVTAPSPGAYRMFFDFKDGGQVRTASFTVIVA